LSQALRRARWGLVFLLALSTVPAFAELPQIYQDWLEQVDLLLTPEERAAFLALGKDYQRDAFIQRFWDERDPIRRTARNELRERWGQKAREARERFGNLKDGRAKVYLLNGAPDQVIESDCSLVLWPLEVWHYLRSDRVAEEFIVVLYRKWGAGPFRVWNPGEGIDVLFSEGILENGPGIEMAATGMQRHSLGQIADLANGCGPGDHGQRIAGSIGWVMGQGMRWDLLQARIESKPEEGGGEWVPTFASYSTDLPEGVGLLPATLEVGFPGRQGNRTVLQGVISVAQAEAGQAKLGEHRSFNLLLTGEVLRGGELFDSFRYKFDFPVTEVAGTIPLAFQRHLRPGDYTLVVKLEDVNSGRMMRVEQALAVPRVDHAVPAPTLDPEEAESARLLAEANAAVSSGEVSVRLVPPGAAMQTGMQRFDTLSTGAGISKVVFSLDGKAVLTKNAPPYSVELDLGSVPRTRILAVTAYDAAGEEVASDELAVNAPGRRFQVRLVEPRRGKRYAGSLLARAEVEVPEGAAVETVEFFLNETRVATLYQPPYAQPIVLKTAEPVAYVRAVATLTDGGSAESLVFVNAPENLEEIDVDFVELYASVLDRRGRPAFDMTARDFAVAEDGVQQEVARFERVADLPIHVAVAIDVSASMVDNLEKAQGAALRFLQGSVRPKDRAAVILFNDHPTLAVKFTGEINALAGGLAGLKAERGTALYDAMVFSLFCFNGIKGQRAVLLLSDGKDEGSRFSFEDALEYARRAGVAIYSIGLGDKIDKRKLEKIAEETGGRAFFPRQADDLRGIYAAVEEELRSK